jgi:hypothetical protein
VDRPVAEVDDLLGVAQRPRSVHATALVTGVRRRGGVGPAQRVREPVVGDGAGEPSVPDALELAVPRVRGHPDLELDVRVDRRPDDAGDTAERGQAVHRLPGGRREGAPAHRDGGGDRRPRQRESDEALARSSRGGRRGRASAERR